MNTHSNEKPSILQNKGKNRVIKMCANRGQMLANEACSSYVIAVEYRLTGSLWCCPFSCGCSPCLGCWWNCWLDQLSWGTWTHSLLRKCPFFGLPSDLKQLQGHSTDIHNLPLCLCIQTGLTGETDGYQMRQRSSGLTVRYPILPLRFIQFVVLKACPSIHLKFLWSTRSQTVIE